MRQQHSERGQNSESGKVLAQTSQGPIMKSELETRVPMKQVQPAKSGKSLARDHGLQEQASRVQDGGVPNLTSNVLQRPKEARNAPSMHIQQTQAMAGPSAGKSAVIIKNEPVEYAQLSALSIPAHKSATPAEEGQDDLLGALEKHLSHAPTHHPAIPGSEPRAGRAMSRRVVYVDEYGREVIRPREPSGPVHRGDVHGRYQLDERVGPDYGHPRSPPSRSDGYNPEAETWSRRQPYRERSPLPARRYTEEVAYYAGSWDYENAYERGPPQAPVYRYRQTAAPRQEYSGAYANDRGRGDDLSHPLDYDARETYEVVRVVDPEGDCYARRPVQRGMPQEGRHVPDHHYASAPGPPRPYEDVGGHAPARREFSGSYPGSTYGGRYHYPDEVAREEHYAGGGKMGHFGSKRTTGPPPSMHRQGMYTDPAYYDEYDPHDPAGGRAVMQGSRQQVRYQ